MGTRAAAIVAVVVVTACRGYGSEAFPCNQDEQCGVGGICEPSTSFCSVIDPNCSSGRKYTDHSGGLSGTCVGGGEPIDSGTNPPDARTDAPPDARVCFGTGIVQVCLATAPTQPFAVSNLTTIDTGDPSMCATLTSGGDYCVIAATNITLNAKLRASGPKPLVLISTDSITSTSTATIDVGSHRVRPAGTPETGAGADPAACGAGTLPTNGGGGAGGSFTGLGGNGGNGNNTANTGGVPGAAVVGAVTALRGGCPGQDGQAMMAGDRGVGGHGGGAIFLIALNRIDIGGGILAGGEGGTAGLQKSSGGGGGGAGGMIGFDAPMVKVTSLLVANGGSGGEGSGTNNAGADGADATTTSAAPAGAGNSANGGDGGDGSAGVAAGAGGQGNTGTTGGGGGGGGAGLVKAPAGADLGTQISPAATL